MCALVRNGLCVFLFLLCVSFIGYLQICQQRQHYEGHNRLWVGPGELSRSPQRQEVSLPDTGRKRKTVSSATFALIIQRWKICDFSPATVHKRPSATCMSYKVIVMLLDMLTCEEEAAPAVAKLMTHLLPLDTFWVSTFFHKLNDNYIYI